MTQLNWLPTLPDWKQRLKALPEDPTAAWDAAVGLANSALNFVQSNALDEALRRIVTTPPAQVGAKTMRLAMLGSSTLSHLQPAIRVGGLRRGICIDVYENEYGQYLQELSDQRFRPLRIQTHFHPDEPRRLSPHRRRPLPRWTRPTPIACPDRTQGAHSRALAARTRKSSAVPSSSRLRCRCTLPCSATTNIGCPARAPASSPA